MINLPRISVVLPTKDRLEYLTQCVESLARQDYPRENWRLIVINDGGQDPSAIITGRFFDSNSATLLSTPAQGPAAARNLGARHAEADLVAFLDDDCVLEPGWLREMATGIWQSPWHACGGQTLNLFPENFSARAYQYFLEFYRGYQHLPNGDPYLLMSNNAIYRRDVFLELGGFADCFPRPGAEDLDLSHRLCARGYRQHYVPEARLRHAHPRTAGRYLRQQFQYGRGYALMRDHLQSLGIPLNIGQRRRPQFHLTLLRTMRQKGPGLREGLLVWGGILAHSAGIRWERPARQRRSIPPARTA